MTEEKRQVIRDYALTLESQGKKNKGPIKEGSSYTVVRYQVYDAKGRCDLCNTEHKAGKQALIRDDVTRDLYQSGTHCLDECLGYDESDLEAQIKGRRSVAARVSQITRQTYDDEGQMVESFIRAFQSLAPEHPEVVKCINNLNAIHGKLPLSEIAEKRLWELVDFYALLNEAMNDSEKYRDRLQALALDPQHTKHQPLNWEIYHRSEDLTVSRVQRLKEVMKTAKSKRKPIKLPDTRFLPWNYENEELYLEAARRHYTELADAGTVRPETLQASYDFETFNYDVVNGEKMYHPRRMEDFLGIVPVPGITPVLAGSRLTEQGWEGERVLRSLEERNKLHHRSLTQAHYHSSVLHQGNVRTDPPEERGREGGGIRRVQAEATGSAQYRCTAYWPVAPWRALYTLWFKYSGRDKTGDGRDHLLTFPETSVQT